MWFTVFLMENYTLMQEPKHWFHQRRAGRTAKTLHWFEACSSSPVNHSGPAAVDWKGLSEGIWEVVFTLGQTVQCCRFELIYYLKELKVMRVERLLHQQSLTVFGEHRWDPWGQNPHWLSSMVLKHKCLAKIPSSLIICSFFFAFFISIYQMDSRYEDKRSDTFLGHTLL